MKLPYLAPALLLHALLAPFALGQTSIPNPATGNISTVSINLTVHETIGGWKMTEAKKLKETAKGYQFPDTIQYDIVFGNSTAPSNIQNPFGWNDSAITNYVERVTVKPEAPNSPMVVTADGWNVISKTRYTTATLLAELAAAGEISGSVKGYRIVAVRFDTLTNGEDVFTNAAAGYMTLVKPGLYFFAEKGANDPVPIYLGAEDNVYDHIPVIDFSSFETAQAGKYRDVFTGRPAPEGGFAYSIASDAYSGLSLAEVTIYRRPPGAAANYHELRAGGVFSWKETYDNRQERNTYNRGAIKGKGLTGPVTLRSSTGTAQLANSGIVSGSITLPTASYSGNLNKYLLQIPRILAE